MEDVKFINVDKTKLDQMQQQCICPFEQPIVAVPLEFKIPGSTSFTSGYLMITCGSHYLFKGKAFGHLTLAMKFSIFQVNIIHFTIEQIIFDFSDFAMMSFSSNTDSQTNPVSMQASSSQSISSTSLQKSSDISKSLIFLKTNDVSIIIRASMLIQRYVTYGIKDVRLCRLDSTIPINEIELKARPIDALKYRTVFFAHYYDKDDTSFLDVDYFRHFEKMKKPYIVINTNLQPGKYARAFGHSIAWERSIKIVSFRSFHPDQFSDFFDSLVINCNSNSTLTEIQFDDYLDPDTLPEFSGRPLKCEHCSIKRYVFRNVLGRFLLSFFEKCSKIPVIEGLILCNIKIESIEFTQFCNLVLHNEGMKNTLKALIIEKSIIPNFPVNDFAIMLGCLSQLETISICDFKFDAVRLVRSICSSKAPVRAMHLNRLRFLKSFDDVTFPDTLIHLDVSLSLFSDDAISSLFVCMTKKPVKIPIIFSAVRITLKKSSYPAIGRIQLDKCHPTIAEFNFSFNRIPAVGSRSLFAFLFTQKKLRNLTLNSIGTTDPVKLLTNIMMIVLSLQISGFSFSPASEKVLSVLNFEKSEKKEQKKQTNPSEISENSSKTVTQDDDLLSFDFDSPQQPSTAAVHSSSFAEDLISLDFTQTANSNSNSTIEPNKSVSVDSKSANDLLSLIETSKKDSKPPPKVSSIEPKTILQFIQALVQQKVVFLRRLVLPNSSTGDEGIVALMKLIDISPNLNELIVDGIRPESVESFIMLWEKIVEHKSIVACDFPKNDIEFLNGKIESENKKIVVDMLCEKIKKKKSPSSTNKRVKYLTQMYQCSDEFVIKADIFEKCAFFNYKNDNINNDQNSGNKEDKSEVWENSQISNDNGNNMDDLLDFDDLS